MTGSVPVPENVPDALVALGWNDRWEAVAAERAVGTSPGRVLRHDSVAVLIGTADDVITRPYGSHVGADGFDDSCALVPQDERSRPGARSVRHLQIAVTHAGCHDLDAASPVTLCAAALPCPGP